MNIELFDFEGNEVRFVGTANKPEWVAADVFSVLGIQWDGHNLDNYEDDEKGRVTIPTPGGEQSLLTITESGLYRTIFKSRKPVAKRFQRWVFHDVIPSIRQTGSYVLPEKEQPVTSPKVETQSDRALAVQDGLAIIKPTFRTSFCNTSSSIKALIFY